MTRVDIMDVEHDLQWKAARRRSSKQCKYLSDPLCLPEPCSHVVNHRTPDIVTSEYSHKDVKMNLIHPRSHSLNLSVLKNGTSKLVQLANPSRIAVPFVKMCFIVLNPSFLISIIHVFLNLFLASVLLYSLGYILYFARLDIIYKIKLKKEEAAALIEEAKRLYSLNKCDPSTRVPAMEEPCRRWRCQIENGFTGIKYTRIVAEMVAEVFDGFVERFRTRNLIVLIVFTMVYLVFRRKS